MKNKWYIIKIITKYENYIIDNIKKILYNNKIKEFKIYNLFNKTIKYKNNKKYIYKTKTLPGYLILYFKLNSLIYYKIKNINGVLYFLNERIDRLPISLNKTEIKSFIDNNKTNNYITKTNKFKKGDYIKIKKGLLSGIKGKVKKITKHNIFLYIYIMGIKTKLLINKNKVKKIYNFNK
ncbi:MAG: hypothetical protein NHF90_00455 [Candidatus Shikimatogenerans sp. JK-2022]|nr:hypothetical protein [Candidatus Shikimatogenerans bostrichidophilus]